MLTKARNPSRFSSAVQKGQKENPSTESLVDIKQRCTDGGSND